jgi:hypothetical protein
MIQEKRRTVQIIKIVGHVDFEYVLNGQKRTVEINAVQYIVMVQQLARQITEKRINVGNVVGVREFRVTFRRIDRVWQHAERGIIEFVETGQVTIRIQQGREFRENGFFQFHMSHLIHHGIRPNHGVPMI